MIRFLHIDPPRPDATLHGTKGAGLLEMARMGLPVPPGFIIPTTEFKSITSEIDRAIRRLGAASVSVRSGAAVSMPGMMDTVLNVDTRKPGSVMAAVSEVYESWMSQRAKLYREATGIEDTIGTAIVVQLMVDGRGQDSGTGVVFTRDPITGVAQLFGEWLKDAQGDELVSGKKTPEMLEMMPQGLHRDLLACAEKLEGRFLDMQEVEFTVDEGELWLLQTRLAKRTATAAVRVAVEMVREGLIDREEALRRVRTDQLAHLALPIVDPAAQGAIIATGLPASPGVVSARVAFTADEAIEIGKKEPVILVRPETSPEDVHGMRAAAAIVTLAGGLTSHAALLARDMGRPCVVGCEELDLRSDDIITVDGHNGIVFAGAVRTIPGIENEHCKEFLSWRATDHRP